MTKLGLLLAALLSISTVAYAQWGGLLWGSQKIAATVAHPVSITPVSANAADTTTSGATLAGFVVTMSDGSTFTGTMTNGDTSGLTSISGQNLVAARNFASTDDGLHSFVVSATENGQTIPITFSLNVQVTGGITCALGPNYGGVVPTPAANAGFTTCIANYDWSQSTNFTYNGHSYNWQSLSGYIGGGGGCSAANPLWWNLSYSGGTIAPCSRYSIVFDSAFGSNVFDALYTPGDWDAGEYATDLETQNSSAPTCSLGPPISCSTGGAPATWFPSQFYIEIVQSLNQNGSYGTGSCGTPIAVVAGIFSWSSPGGPLETDQSEIYNNGDACTNGGNTIDHSTNTFLSTSPQIGSSVDSASVNTYGTLQTANASTNLWSRCNYNNSGVISPTAAARTQIGCGTATLSSGALTTRSEWKIPVGPEQNAAGGCPSCRPSGNLDWHIQRITIWACSGWATGHC